MLVAKEGLESRSRGPRPKRRWPCRRHVEGAPARQRADIEGATKGECRHLDDPARPTISSRNYLRVPWSQVSRVERNTVCCALCAPHKCRARALGSVAPKRHHHRRQCKMQSTCTNEVATMTAAQLGDALASFGGPLFESLCKESPAKNVVLSPFVVSVVLGMATAGATSGGTVESELLRVLGVRSHADVATLSSSVVASHGATVRAANAVYTKRDILPEFVELVKSVHGAAAGPLGTSFAPINAWVAEQTEGRVKELLSDPVDPLLVAVLISAVYFKGAWAASFNPEATRPGTFNAVDGRSLEAMLMHRTGQMLASASVDALGGAAAVRLDYGAGDANTPRDFCALLVLPKGAGAAPLAEAVAALAHAGAMRAVLGELRDQKVDLALPRLKARYGSASLKAALRAKGLAAAFDGVAGFLQMAADRTVRAATAQPCDATITP